MSRIRATLDIDTERLAEIIALRVVAMLGGQAPGQGDYPRDSTPPGEPLPPEVEGEQLGRHWPADTTSTDGTRRWT